jgi:anti-sigma B factor antagonist
MDPQLTLSVHANTDHVVLAVGGEVDLATAAQLRARLTDLVDDGAGSVVVDLTPVAFMDSTGLEALLAGRRRARARGRSIRLVCPEGRVLRVLRLTGIARCFPIYGSLAEAVGAQPHGADAN